MICLRTLSGRSKFYRADRLYTIGQDVYIKLRQKQNDCPLGSRFTFAMFILSKDRLLSLFTITGYLRMSMNESERPIQYPASLDVPIVFDPANSSLMNFIISLPPGATKKHDVIYKDCSALS